MNYVLSLFIPIIAFASLSSTDVYTVEPPLIAEKPRVSETVAPSEVLEVEPPTEKIAENPFESCVRTVRLTYPEAPLIDARQYPLNGTLENSEIIVLKYERYDGYIFHIAPIATTTQEEIILGREGNFVAGTETNGRAIKKTAPEIVGYFDLELWLEIQKLSPQLKAILEDESDYNHYFPSGSVIKGSANEFGIAQFKRRTWNWFNQLRAEQELPKIYEILNPFNQVEMLKWAEENNLLEHWSCVKEKRC